MGADILIHIILTYAFPGLRASISQIKDLDVCWNRVYTNNVYRKIFLYIFTTDGSQLNVA